MSTIRSRASFAAPAARQGGGQGAIATLLAAFALLLAFACLAGPAAADPTFPALTGRVVDDAHVLTPEVTAGLTEKLAALEAKTGRQLVVVTLPSLQGYDIEDYGYQLGRHWGIGQKDKDTGVLLIVAPTEKKVRIEVGYGLEPILTDALSSVILQTQVLPRFRAGDISGGVVAGTDALVQQLGLSPEEAQAQVQQAEQQVQRPRPRRHEGIGAVFSLLLLVFVFSAFFRGGRRGGGVGWILPMMFLGGGFGGRDRDDDGWGGGGFGGGGGDGGGFSGGGGSFGGGGSSGSW
jgi:uncharacterized protein